MYFAKLLSSMMMMILHTLEIFTKIKGTSFQFIKVYISNIKESKKEKALQESLHCHYSTRWHVLSITDLILMPVEYQQKSLLEETLSLCLQIAYDIHTLPMSSHSK